MNIRTLLAGIAALTAASSFSQEALQSAINKAGYTSVVAHGTTVGDEIPARVFAASGRYQVWNFKTLFENGSFKPYHRVGFYSLGQGAHPSINWLVGGLMTGLPAQTSVVINGVFGLALDAGDHAGKGDTIFYTEPNLNASGDQVKVLKTRIGTNLVNNDFIAGFEDVPLNKSDKSFDDEGVRFGGTALPPLAYNVFTFEVNKPTGPVVNSSTPGALYHGWRFASAGASVDVSEGLSPFLSQAYWKPFRLTFAPGVVAASKQGGIGTLSWLDRELRNTPAHGADMLLLSNFLAPYGYNAWDLIIQMSSVDKATNEGFLVYGVNFKPDRKEAILLAHVFGDQNGNGWYRVGAQSFSKYAAFAVTADNNAASSVLLGNRTQLISTAKLPGIAP